MSLPRRLKHLPEADWPPEDHLLFQEAFTTGDIFDDDRRRGRPPLGAHAQNHPLRLAALAWLPGCRRIRRTSSSPRPTASRRMRVRAYIEYLSSPRCHSISMNATSVAMTVTQLYNAARLIAPDRDWCWLKALKRRLLARGKPEDRFERLVPAHQTLDLGMTLMEKADRPSDRRPHGARDPVPRRADHRDPEPLADPPPQPRRAHPRPPCQASSATITSSCCSFPKTPSPVAWKAGRCRRSSAPLSSAISTRSGRG